MPERGPSGARSYAVIEQIVIGAWRDKVRSSHQWGGGGVESRIARAGTRRSPADLCSVGPVEVLGVVVERGMLLRARWAAIGAACAVAFGGGVIQVTHATSSSGQRAVFVAITPCRLVSTMPAPHRVGPRSTPLHAGEVFTQKVTGTNGRCTIPADAVAASLNVVAIHGTTASFFTVYSADVARPPTSNLNWVAGAPPTSNKVDVKLSATGAIKVYNAVGRVDLIIDVAGYYVDHNHDDRYYTKTQIDTKLGPTTHSLSFDGLGAIDATLAPSTFLKTSTACSILGANKSAFVSLNLPVGAVITGLIVRVWDTSPDSNLTAALYEHTTSTSFAVSSPVSSIGSSGASTIGLTSLQTATAVGVNVGYHLLVLTGSIASGGVWYCGGTVVYTL